MARVSLNGGDEIDVQEDGSGSSNRKKQKLTPSNASAPPPPPPPPPPVVLPPDDEEDDEEDDNEEDDSEDAESDDEDEESEHQVNEETNNDRRLTLTLTDPDLFNCTVCFESLQSPIFQCVKAHIICSSCRFKTTSTCPRCQYSVAFNRCWALEKILEASEVACKNSIYGCKIMMKYHYKREHERLCSYSPCSCPIYTCDFVDSTLNLYNHIGSKHSTTIFDFIMPFSASLVKHQSYLLLRERTLGSIFVLNQFTIRQGRAVSIVQIAPKTSSGKYRYELKLKDGETSLTLQSPVECVPKLDDYRPTKHFVVVEDFPCPPHEHLTLDICISHPGY